MAEMKLVGRLWLKRNDEGLYLAGSLLEEIPVGHRVLVFNNGPKSEETGPDCLLFSMPPERPLFTP